MGEQCDRVLSLPHSSWCADKAAGLQAQMHREEMSLSGDVQREGLADPEVLQFE